MLSLRPLALVFLGLAVPELAIADGLEVRLFPEGELHAHATGGRRPVYDVVLHTVVIGHRGADAVHLEGLEVEARAGGRTIAIAHVDAGEMLAATQQAIGMAQGPMAPLGELDLPPAEIPGEGWEWAESTTLTDGTSLMAASIYLAASARPDEVLLRARARTAHDSESTRELAVPLAAPDRAVKYHLPVRGNWFMSAVPMPTSHHRWHWQTEFAVDFWMQGDGGAVYTGPTPPADPEVFFGWGEPVLAAADGVVVAIENDAEQDWSVFARREGEARADYGRRVMQYNATRMAKNLRSNLIGNHVIVEHGDGEWSSYGHLRRGSVTVSKGDRVERGQQIGEVGNTGDTHLVHLHFQVNDGPDPLDSRSLPVRFEGVRSPLDPGVLVSSPGN